MSPMQFFDPPLLRYLGAKWQLADWIIEQFPAHVCYVEPFCGSAAIFLRKGPSKVEVLNDLNDEVINFFEVLRRQPEALIHAIEMTPYARAEYDQSFELPDPAVFELVDLPLERARRFYVRSRMAFGVDGRIKSGWRAQKNMTRGTSLTGEWRRTKGLWAGADRLKDAQIECLPALDVIDRYDGPDTLFYVDPPYVLDSRKRAVKRYQHEMTDEEHRQLAARLHTVEGSVILSGYRSDLYDELYAGWRCISKTTTTNGNSTAVEHLWFSPRAFELRFPMFMEQTL